MLKLENSIRGLSFSRVAFDLTIQDKKNRVSDYNAYSDVVRITGLEPAWVAPHEPESCASANSAISARLNYYIKCTFKIQ